MPQYGPGALRRFRDDTLIAKTCSRTDEAPFMASAVATHYIEDLEVGQSETYTRTITEADVQQFGAVSGDLNPLHFDEEYAKTTLFRGRIAHGMLSLSYISTVLGTKLPC